MAVTVNIYYSGVGGNARKFAEEMMTSGVVDDIRAEDGNIRYEYFFPMQDEETVLLIDSWKDQHSIDVHHASPMMKKIIELREKYDLHMEVERYVSDDSGIPDSDKSFIRTRLDFAHRRRIMAIHIRESQSETMKKNIHTVQQVTKGMGFDENMGKVNWSFVRAISNFGYRFMPKEKGVKYKKIKLGNIKAIISEYGQTSSENIILYIHGGGFVSGSAASSKGYCSMLAKYSGYKVIAIDYALSPKYAFPNGFNDCYNAFNEILRLHPNAKITLVGESAGASLCLSVALKAKSTEKISCVLVHSPFVDFTDSLDRTEHKINDFTVKQGCLKPLNQIYVAGNKADNPFISPIFGDFSGFPPTFITCDYNETLYADSKALYDKIADAQIDVELVEVKGAFHAFATIGTGTPETKRILEENIAFMNKYI